MRKFNLLALVLFVCGVVAVFTLNTPTTLRIQQRVLELFSPFIHSSSGVDHLVNAAATPELDPVEVARNNEQLRIEVQRLRIVAQKYNELIDENNQLREVVGFKRASPFQITPARVVKRSSSTWWNTLLIDKGVLDGIGTDSPVITDQGLVGKTGKLAPHLAEVILLTDEMCRVSAKVEGTLEQGILSGERAGLDMRPNLRLRFLSRNAPISIGANVYSSGEGGVFPANLLLGRVKMFMNQDLSGEAIVEPAVDFSNLEYVFVVAMQEVVQTAAPVPPAEGVEEKTNEVATPAPAAEVDSQ
ncbi:MAG: rod shape-determining protein MreC [Verrucomicrobiales bacterium]|nr:rod shape-determining protein MreC [Verrucomicrobiales bacterium]